MSWQENLVEDEMPPEWMWTIPWKLEEWFEEVDRARKEKYRNDDEDEEAEMIGNELAIPRR